MDYKGKIYGKVGITYVPMAKDSEYFDGLENRLKEISRIYKLSKTK